MPYDYNVILLCHGRRTGLCTFVDLHCKELNIPIIMKLRT